MGGTHALMKSVERKIASIPVSALGNSKPSRRGQGQLGKIVVRVHGTKTFSEPPPGWCTFGAAATPRSPAALSMNPRKGPPSHVVLHLLERTLSCRYFRRASPHAARPRSRGQSRAGRLRAADPPAPGGALP